MAGVANDCGGGAQIGGVTPCERVARLGAWRGSSPRTGAKGAGVERVPCLVFNLF